MHSFLKVPLVTSALSYSESAHNLLSKCWLNAAVTGDAKMLFPKGGGGGSNNRKQSLSKDNRSMLPNSLILTSLDIFTSIKKIKGRFINTSASEPRLGVKDKRLSLLLPSGEKEGHSFSLLFPECFPKRPAVDG